MAHLIRTECLIAASPERVWAVLSDFAAWPDWNPLNLSAEGPLEQGARVRMVFRNLAGRPGTVIRQTVTLVACRPGLELAWTGDVPLLFHGRHGFLLSAEDGGARVVQTEALSGLLPATWSRERIARDFTPAYQAVDRALARRVAAA